LKLVILRNLDDFFVQLNLNFQFFIQLGVAQRAQAIRCSNGTSLEQSFCRVILSEAEGGAKSLPAGQAVIFAAIHNAGVNAISSSV
jgi:hypothetical protein